MLLLTVPSKSRARWLRKLAFDEANDVVKIVVYIMEVSFNVVSVVTKGVGGITVRLPRANRVGTAVFKIRAEEYLKKSHFNQFSRDCWFKEKNLLHPSSNYQHVPECCGYSLDLPE